MELTNRLAELPPLYCFSWHLLRQIPMPSLKDRINRHANQGRLFLQQSRYSLNRYKDTRQLFGENHLCEAYDRPDRLKFPSLVVGLKPLNQLRYYNGKIQL